MRVVSNTSPVLNLAIIDRLDLLQQQFGDVIIPPAVRVELRPDAGLPGSPAVCRALAAGWIRVHEVADRPLADALARDLDQGEAEAIALALQTGADRVLLDERAGRKVARSLGLHPIGVLGILARGHRDGHLESLAEAIADLQTRAGFGLAPALVAQVLSEANRDH